MGHQDFSGIDCPLGDRLFFLQACVSVQILSSCYGSLRIILLKSDVFKLDAKEKLKLDEENSFPIRPYGSARVPILGRVTLTGARLEEIRKEFLAATRPGSRQALCHYSIYGFRFYRGPALVVETSVYFQCHNFYAPKDGGYHWEASADFTGNFQRSLDEILPAPKENTAN